MKKNAESNQFLDKGIWLEIHDSIKITRDGNVLRSLTLRSFRASKRVTLIVAINNLFV